MSTSLMGRRTFLRRTATVSAGAALLAGLVPAARADAAAPKGLRMATQWGMLPEALSMQERCALAKTVGFSGIETSPMDDLDAARALGEAARAAGVPVHSVVYGGWDSPFSSPDDAVIAKGLAGMRKALRTAKAAGAGAVLLVPAVVNEQTRYVDAYERSQRHIRTLIPDAKEHNVVIAVENVWNNFLLSPLEFARYVDEFDSPFVKAYFDVGNVVAFGWPQDWIRTLGPRIVRVHLKDFKREGRAWVNLGDGDVNWPEVRRALDEVEYSGYATAEMPAGDEAYLRDLAGRMGRLLAPVA